MFYLLGLPLIAHHFGRLKNRQNLIAAVFLYITSTAVFSIIQYAYYPNLRNLQYLGWDPHQYRMFGTVFDTSTSSALYGLILIFLIVKGKASLKNPFLWFGSSVLFGVIGALTYARGFYLAFTATFLYHLVIHNKKIISAFYLILIAVGLLVVIPKPPGESANLRRVFTIQSRVADYETGFTLFRHNLLFGVGYNHLRYVKPDQSGDTTNHAASSLSSSFLIILSTMGLVGFVTFVLMLINLAKTSRVAAYSIIFVSLYSLSDNIILHPLILFLVSTVVALGREVQTKHKKNAK
jgi:hypothetical protein